MTDKNPDWPKQITLLLVEDAIGISWRCTLDQSLEDAIGSARRAEKILATAVADIDWTPFSDDVRPR